MGCITVCNLGGNLGDGVILTENSRLDFPIGCVLYWFIYNGIMVLLPFLFCFDQIRVMNDPKEQSFGKVTKNRVWVIKKLLHGTMVLSWGDVYSNLQQRTMAVK